MPERPLLLFPKPERAGRIKRRMNPSQPKFPSIARQYDRLTPNFSVLKHVFQQKAVAIQNSPVGLNPEVALVFEVVGSVENFYTAVKKVEGMEWIFEATTEKIEPDDDFYLVAKSGEPTIGKYRN